MKNCRLSLIVLVVWCLPACSAKPTRQVQPPGPPAEVLKTFAPLFEQGRKWTFVQTTETETDEVASDDTEARKPVTTQWSVTHASTECTVDSVSRTAHASVSKISCLGVLEPALAGEWVLDQRGLVFNKDVVFSAAMLEQLATHETVNIAGDRFSGTRTAGLLSASANDGTGQSQDFMFDANGFARASFSPGGDSTVTRNSHWRRADLPDLTAAP